MLPAAAAAIVPADDLLRELLAVSLTGVIYYTPLYDPAGSGGIVDFSFAYLNPAAQRMMHMPEEPTRTHSAAVAAQQAARHLRLPRGRLRDRRAPGLQH